MLYGGMGADSKPLNDAWVLDLEKPAWSLVYMAHPDLCPPQVFVVLLVMLVNIAIKVWLVLPPTVDLCGTTCVFHMSTLLSLLCR